MNAEWRTLAARTVPRYTSYPTAPHFTSAIGPEVAAGWLAGQTDESTLSLYIHVPYCEQLCRYCGCHTKMVRRRHPIETYTDRLVDEITTVGAAMRGKVVHIHFGGGTPSILASDGLHRVSAALNASFDLAAVREHAIELDPRRMTEALVSALASTGVNRASLGVQEFSAHVQEAIGRIQPYEVVADAVVALRRAGVGRIAFDLMYGLPRQTARDAQRTAELAASLRPQRIALFGYAHVPWFKPHQRLIDEASLPGTQARLEQAEISRSTLIALGYAPIGIDHFAWPDDELAEAARAKRLRRNFQGYTTDNADALIGLGASAIGRLPQGFLQNAVDIRSYSQAVQSGGIAAAKGFALSPADRLRARVIEDLMCYFEVDLDEIATEVQFEEDFQSELARLSPFIETGLVRIDGRRIAVTDEGRPFARIVASTFDSYLQTGQARHSAAV